MTYITAICRIICFTWGYSQTQTQLIISSPLKIGTAGQKGVSAGWVHMQLWMVLWHIYAFIYIFTTSSYPSICQDKEIMNKAEGCGECVFIYFSKTFLTTIWLLFLLALLISSTGLSPHYHPTGPPDRHIVIINMRKYFFLICFSVDKMSWISGW